MVIAKLWFPRRRGMIGRRRKKERKDGELGEEESGEDEPAAKLMAAMRLCLCVTEETLS